MLNILKPDYYYKNICNINLKKLKNIGIKGIICDIDNTIVKWSEEEIGQDIKQWFEILTKMGFEICLVTNGLGGRAEYFSEKMDIPALGQALKPAKPTYKKAQNLLGLNPDEIVVIGDQIFTDIFGGNRLGFMTILVDPLTDKEFITTKFFRLLEKLFFTRDD